MSLAIEVDRIAEVMVGNTWYAVAESSFELDSYEFLWYPNDAAREQDEFVLMHGGGSSGVCATGFVFETECGRMHGPLTAIQAVRYRRTE